MASAEPRTLCFSLSMQAEAFFPPKRRNHHIFHRRAGMEKNLRIFQELCKSLDCVLLSPIINASDLGTRVWWIINRFEPFYPQMPALSGRNACEGICMAALTEKGGTERRNGHSRNERSSRLEFQTGLCTHSQFSGHQVPGCLDGRSIRTGERNVCLAKARISEGGN